MIAVKVVAPFALKEAAPDGTVQLPEKTSILRLLRMQGAPPFAYLLPVAVNGVQAGKNHRLKAGDVVVFLAPITGG
jgi:molybdopterin converting factor small subunit